MKFTYRWKIGGQMLTGSFNCQNEIVLKHHVESVGGQLVEILRPGASVTDIKIEDGSDASYED